MHAFLHDLTIYIYKHVYDVALLLSSLLSIFRRYFFPSQLFGVVLYQICTYTIPFIPIRSVVWLFYYRWLCYRNSCAACLFYWYKWAPAPVSALVMDSNWVNLNVFATPLCNKSNWINYLGSAGGDTFLSSWLWLLCLLRRLPGTTLWLSFFLF